MRNLTFLKLFLTTMFVMTTAFFTSCVDDNDDTEAPYLEVSPTNLSFGSDGQPVSGSQASFDISTNRHWKATVKDDISWVTLSKYEGDGSATIQVSIPEGINDRASIVIEVSNKIGVLFSKTVTIKSGSASEPVVIYHETVGSMAVSSPWPTTDKYEGWNKSGSGATNVTYGGTSSTIRSSGLANTDAYEGASGPNVVFFGTLPSSFVINNIALPADETNLQLTFGASYSLKPEGATDYDNTFDPTKFTVSLSADGTNWTPITYTKNNGDAKSPYWILATANFTLKQYTASLYIKFTALAASAIRLDDITLSTGNGGTEVDLGGGGSELPELGENVTIPELIARMTADKVVLDENADHYLVGVVQNDIEGGNYSFNNLILATQNATTAKNGITLYGSQIEPSTLNLNKGDIVKVTLKKGLAQIQNYKGMYEITGDKDADWASIQKTGTATVTPIVITADKLAEYQGMPVTIQGATTAEGGVWANSTDISKHTFTATGTDFTVFCKKGAGVFVDIPFKAATGSISGLAAVNNNAAQLVPRSLADVTAFNSSTPTIVSVDPTSLSFPATGGTQSITVTTANEGTNTLSINTLTGILSAKKTDNKTIEVTAKANTGATEETQDLIISLTGGNQVTVPITIAAAGSSDTKGTYTSIPSFIFANGSNVGSSYGEKVKINDTEFDCIKLGTSSKCGTFTSGAVGVTGSKKLSFYAGAWNAKKATVYLKVNNGGEISGNNSAELTANTGIANSTPYTVTFSDSDYYTFNITGLTANSTITISTDPNFGAGTSNTRAVFCGFQLY